MPSIGIMPRPGTKKREEMEWGVLGVVFHLPIPKHILPSSEGDVPAEQNKGLPY